MNTLRWLVTGVSFSDFTLAIRIAIARLKEGQEEYLLNLSIPRGEDPDNLVLVVRGLRSFLNSGSFGLRIACSVPGVVISEGFRKNSGPLSQLETARSFGCRPLVARSAGLTELYTYLH